MLTRFPAVRTALLVVLVAGCGRTYEPNRSARSGPGDDPGLTAPSTPDAGGSTVDPAHPKRDAGDLATDDFLGAAREPCSIVDGRVSYGPIGERRVLPLPTAPERFGFRTARGYAFVWRTLYDPRAPSPNLFVATLDADFTEVETRPLGGDASASALEVVRAPRGFLAVICREESHVEWLPLGEDFAESTSPLTAPEAPCKSALPAVLWTGEVTLVSFVDARGFVVSCLDERGAVVGEEVLDPHVTEPIPSRFSKNGDLVLLVLARGSTAETRYAVFDRYGTRLTELRSFGGEYTGAWDIAIAPNASGWLVATDDWTEGHGALRVVASDGRLVREDEWFGRYVVRLDLTPSLHGGGLLIAGWDTGGQFGAAVAQVALIDDAGEAVYSEERPDGVPFPTGFVVDADGDLILEGFAGQVTAQEYGCLD